MVELRGVRVEPFELVPDEADFEDTVVEGGLLGECDMLHQQIPYSAYGDGVEVVAEALVEGMGWLV